MPGLMRNAPANRRAITKWMKGMGQKLLAGNLNLINTPFPVDIFEPRSYLEKLADVWVYPRYLRQAAASSDPVERMKLVITWFIAGVFQQTYPRAHGVGAADKPSLDCRLGVIT